MKNDFKTTSLLNAWNHIKIRIPPILLLTDCTNSSAWLRFSPHTWRDKNRLFVAARTSSAPSPLPSVISLRHRLLWRHCCTPTIIRWFLSLLHRTAVVLDSTMDFLGNQPSQSADWCQIVTWSNNWQRSRPALGCKLLMVELHDGEQSKMLLVENVSTLI